MMTDARRILRARWIFIASPATTRWNCFWTRRFRLPKLKIAWRLLQKKLGFRMLMDVIPLDATLVKGSHGRQAGG